MLSHWGTSSRVDATLTTHQPICDMASPATLHITNELTVTENLKQCAYYNVFWSRDGRMHAWCDSHAMIAVVSTVFHRSQTAYSRRVIDSDGLDCWRENASLKLKVFMFFTLPLMDIHQMNVNDVKLYWSNGFLYTFCTRTNQWPDPTFKSQMVSSEPSLQTIRPLERWTSKWTQIYVFLPFFTIGIYDCI